MIKVHTKTDSTFSFSLRTESGNILLKSVSFLEKLEMDKVLRKLDTIRLTRNHFERKTNTEGKFLFSLQDENGKTIGSSEPFDSEAGMENGIKNLREQIRTLS